MTNANDLMHSFSDSEMHMGNNKGLTKREYFSAMALQGLLAHGWNVHEYKDAAIHATKAADALINALNETK
jgi:hypothetical protein